jgi:antitoxin (DNA-binding transcriptional repressor) of toxin-antitoxin stability system
MPISMREFKSHLVEYVIRAQSGVIIELTSHRKVVARLIGVSASEHPGITRLLGAGAAT